MRFFVLLRRLCLLLLIAAGTPAFFPLILAAEEDATSASITLSGEEGAIPLQASATFATHTFCNGASPPNCWKSNSGTLTVSQKHPNGATYYMASKSGEGSANWSTTLDTGAMAQGTHTFVATACDSKRICSSSSQSITIDNTPELTASSGSTEGDLKIKGTVDFKEYVGGYEGYIDIYYITPNGARSYIKRKYYEGTEAIAWTWEEIAGYIPDGGKWSQGKYTVQIIAVANNGASKQFDLPITIDNTPKLTASSGSTEGDLKIKGTVDFKEYVGGYEGYIDIYYITPNGARSYIKRKYYEGTEAIAWTWEEIAGYIPDGGKWSQGKYTVQIIAVANNGASKQFDLPITIDNTPELTASSGSTEGDLKIKGTVDFKEYVGGYEGYIDIYYITPNGARSYIKRKYYEGTEAIAWTWEEIAGYIPDGGKWSQGKYTVQIIAVANNGASKQFDLPITIDNTPELTASSGSTEGDLKIKGTVDFKEYVGGYEGYIDIYYITPNGARSYIKRKYYEGTEAIAWTWEEIAGYIPDGGKWSQGKYTVQIIAVANNGASKQFDLPITIDNTPKVNIVGPRYFADLTFDILGTVSFKEYANGAEGTVTMYLKEVSASSYSRYGSKSNEGTSVNWKYSDFTGARLSKATWGGKELMVQVIATAANGTTATAQQFLIVPALGCPLPLR